MQLHRAIEEECDKLILRHFAKLAGLHKVQRRFERATGVTAGKKRNTDPRQWAAAPCFNPFRVRRRSDIVAKAIEHRLAAGEYSPRPSLVLPIPKPAGGSRQISVFPVADAAVARVFFGRLLRRNQSRLSPFSYAYRSDIGAHDAIERLWHKFGARSRFYVVEFDFSKYFDTISHEYLLRTLHDNFKVTRTESAVIRAILRCRRAFGVDAYCKGRFVGNHRGIPQGNCLSLFLANAACHELDRRLGNDGFQFARYADDILLFCHNDSDASQAFETIVEHCSSTGLAINFSKSEGIKVCSPAALGQQSPGGEKSHVDYLGHRFNYQVVQKNNHPSPQLVRRLSIRPATEKRIRERLSNIIYSHLLRYPLAGQFRRTRVDSKLCIDWDVVTCINDLRGYIYGGMSQDEIDRALGDRTVRLHHSSGIMGFFPLVNDLVQLKALDGWMQHALVGAVRRRASLLRRQFRVRKYPGLSSEELLQATWYDETATGIANDVRLPSFVTAWKYANRGLKAFNLRQFPARKAGAGDESLYDALP